MKIKYRLHSLFCLLLVCFLLIPPTDVEAKGLPSGDFKVNQYYKSESKMKEIRKQIFQEMKTWGMTDESICGVIGNMRAESGGCDYTLTQNYVSWKRVRYGVTGLGLTQWTYHTRQDRLFKMAKKMKMGWNELPVQMALLKEELTKSEYVKWSTFSKSTDLKECTKQFLYKYENPKVKNLNARYELAKKTYKDLKGVEPKALDGTSSGSSDSDTSTTEKKSTVNNVLDEWDLVGMPVKSKLMDSVQAIELEDTSSLGVKENYSIQVVRDDLYTGRLESIIENARIGVVFAGLLLIFYCILLFFAILFDKSNQFLEISLVSILTFGRLNYSDEEYSNGTKSYAGTGKLFKSVVIILIVGMFLVSGGIFAYLSRIMLFVSQKIM